MRISPSGIVGKLTAGTNVTITGTPVNPTVNSSGGSGGGPTTQTNVTGSRSLGAIFQNTTGKPLYVLVTVVGVGGQSAISAFSDSSATPTLNVAFQFINATSNVCLFFIVLPGNFYQVISALASTLTVWVEYN